MYGNKKIYLMLYFLYKYKIALTAMQLNSLELVYDIYRYVQNCFLLHVHKFRMTKMCDGMKWIGMHETKNYI
jgi:hypothetical protein